MDRSVKGSQSAYLLSEVGAEAEAARLRSQAAVVLALELPRILADIPPAGVFWDLGCGSGVLADAVAAARPDVRVLGLDADPMAVSEAQRVFGGREGLEFLVHPIGAGAPDRERPDVMAMRLVLMHLPGPAEVLSALLGWAKPGGALHVIEGDDRDLAIEPGGPWVERLLASMRRVQAARGGDRCLGRELQRLLEGAAWEGVVSEKVQLDPVRTAAAAPRVFGPVAEFYLGQAEEHGILSPDKAAELREAVQKGLANATAVHAPLHHAVARRPRSPR